MNILMVIPPYRTTDTLTAQLYPLPYGPVLVASTLERAGHHVLVKDFLCPAVKSKTPSPACFAGKNAPPYMHHGAPMDECLAWLEDNAGDYDAVGLAGCQCNLWESVQMLARKIKEMDLPLVMGGPFVTTATDEAFDKFGMDVAVTYEGEWVAEEAFTRAVAGETGVVINGGDGKRDISDLPVPNYDLLDTPITEYPKYGSRHRGVLAVSRGCPWQCEFCSVFTVMSRKHRRLGRARIKEELMNLFTRGVTYMCFLDDNLFISEKATDELLAAVAELDAEVPGFKRVKFYVEEGMEVRMAARPGFMKKLAGGRWENLAIGLETANTAAATQAKKPYKPEDVPAAIENCRAAGITTKAFYIIGFPNDTMESVAADLVRFASFGMAARPNNLKLYPGTGATNKFRAAGRINDTYDWRLSTFYTPHTGKLSYKVIRKLKTTLGAIGMAQDMFGVDPFADSMDVIQTKLAENKYTLTLEENGVILEGNMFRNSMYRALAEILCGRHTGAPGAASKPGPNIVHAHATTAAKNEVQRALFVAMRGEAITKTGLLF